MKDPAPLPSVALPGTPVAVTLPTLTTPLLFHISPEAEQALAAMVEAIPPARRGAAYLSVEVVAPPKEPPSGRIAAGIAVHAADTSRLDVDVAAGAQYDTRRGAQAALQVRLVF